MAEKTSLRYYFLIILILILSNVFVWRFVFGLNNNLKVIFFDIGQGDSIFIETPTKHQILIDGGPSNSTIEKLGKVMPFWDKTLDVVVLTHPDYDHLRGLLDILDYYKVENIIWTSELSQGKTFEAWQEKIKKEKASIYFAKAGMKITTYQTKIDILYPAELPRKNSKNNNDTSIVARMVFGQTEFFFSGDINREIEQEIVLGGHNILSDVLKVSHHGSKSATSLEFLANIKPSVAVISSGKNNSYGHPHQEVLSVLREFGIKILRTDQMGDIKIISDGRNIFY